MKDKLLKLLGTLVFELKFLESPLDMGKAKNNFNSTGPVTPGAYGYICDCVTPPNTTIMTVQFEYTKLDGKGI